MKDRRSFLKQSLTAVGALASLQALARPIIENPRRERLSPKPSATARFSVIGLNHGHIYGQTDAMIRGGGQLVAFYAKENDLAEAYAKKYPDAKRASSEKEILEDSSVQLIVSASIPADRAPLGIEVMKHGKDFLVDKPGVTTLKQFAEVKKVQKETKRIYSVMYSERFENRATVKAGELVKSGAIGNVIQTIGMGPHRINLPSRPQWFFDKKYFGGIICDIGSHQFDQFLFFTNSTKGEVVASQTGNVHYPQYPEFEDFGDVMVRGDGGAGYIRVDWFTPDGLNTWGDGRLTILGTDGYIELRKNVDIAGHEGGNHLFLVDKKETRYIDCSQEPLTFGEQFIADVANRTNTAMTQEHCFLATELALQAQEKAQKLVLKK
ncbi:MAG: Gfo/Idh/MocA family oxidoreductase [Bacteroidota bacterium]